MQVEKKDLEKSQVELNVTLTKEEFKPFIEKGAVKVSKDVKIEGFRPGKVPYDVLKGKIGEMSILEESARLAIEGTIEKVIKEHVPERQPVGQPKVDITKLAPDNPLEYKIVLALLPEVTLKDYKDLKIKKKKVEIKDADMEKTLDELREMRASEVVVEREIKEGDKALADIQMFLDKVPVEGGQSKDAAVMIGKDYIVPGFDKKLIGAKKNDIKEFSLPYPKDFHMKNLAGKMVEFKVTIKDVFERQMPEMNDEFAAGFGLKNIDELKDNIKKSIEEQKTQEAKQLAEKEMLEKIIEKARFGDIPEVLIEHESHNMMHELEHGIEDQGGKFEDYLKSLNKTPEQMILEMLPEAIKRVKVSLIVREVANIEKIKVSTEEFNKHLEDIKKTYVNDKEMMERVAAPEYKNYALNVLSGRKVVDKLSEWNIVK